MIHYSRFRLNSIGLVLLGLFLLICLIYYVLLQNGIVCSSYHFKNSVLPQLCENNTPHVIILPISEKEKSPLPVSDLCTYLCSPPFDILCHTQHLNKPYVFTMNEKHKEDFKIVVKSVVNNADKDLQVYWKQRREDGMPVIPTEEELKSMVSSQIGLFLGTSVDHTLIPINSIMFTLPTHNLALHEQLWKFIDDHEFLISYLFHNQRLFPQLLGVCKDFYAVEYAYPPMQNPLLPFNIPWNVSLKKAIDLVNLIEKLDSHWKEPIHLCDMKHDHFGWTNDNETLFLDLDSVFTDSALKDVMANNPECSSDDDCSFFDCTGKCLPDKQCSKERVNSNLQMLCSKIFLGNAETSLWPLYGLLEDINEHSTSLTEALQLCSTNPGMTTDIMVHILESEYKSLSSNKKLVEL